MTWRAKVEFRCLISTGPWCHGAVAAWRAARNRGIACRVLRRQQATPRRFVGFSDNKQALRRRFYRASSLSLRFLRILRCFYKALKYNKIWKIAFFALCQKGTLTKNSLENFLSSRLFDTVISPFWSHEKAFLTKSTHCFFWFIRHFEWYGNHEGRKVLAWNTVHLEIHRHFVSWPWSCY